MVRGCVFTVWTSVNSIWTMCHEIVVHSITQTKEKRKILRDHPQHVTCSGDVALKHICALCCSEWHTSSTGTATSSLREHPAPPRHRYRYEHETSMASRTRLVYQLCSITSMKTRNTETVSEQSVGNCLSHTSNKTSIKPGQDLPHQS